MVVIGVVSDNLTEAREVVTFVRTAAAELTLVTALVRVSEDAAEVIAAAVVVIGAVVTAVGVVTEVTSKGADTESSETVRYSITALFTSFFPDTEPYITTAMNTDVKAQTKDSEKGSHSLFATLPIYVFSLLPLIYPTLLTVF